MRRIWHSLALFGLLLAVCAGPAHAALAGRRLARDLAASLSAVGGNSGAYVVDLRTGKALFSAAASTPRMPASVEKLYTTSTALLRYGADANLTTGILGRGNLDALGTWHGTLYLKGGGDPTFGSAGYDRYAYGTGATVQRLVANLRKAGIRSLSGSIVGDESIFDPLRGTIATGYDPSSYLEGELSGLAYNRGLADEQGTAFQGRPALFAAHRLMDALRAAGVRVPGRTPVFSGRTPADASPLALVHSPRIATLAQLTNTPSDNFFAEMLLKGLGARFGAGGSSAAGVSVVRTQISASFGIHPTVVDGSGLSRRDRTSPRDVVTVLRALAGNRAFTDSLSIAGETGTMQAGLAGTAAQGRCRGKTGTLHDVAALVGLCTALDGHPLAFAFLMNGVDPVAGHSAEDDMAVALARYSG